MMSRFSVLASVMTVVASAFLVVLPAGTAAEAPGSKNVSLVTRNGSTIVVSAADWGRLPRTTVEVIDKHGVAGKYEGVAMSELMKLVNVPSGEKLRGDWLRCYVVAEAEDGYQAIYVLPELDPAFAKSTVILADRKDGTPLGEKNGPLQLIAPGDKRGARWVRMVKRIAVVDHAPDAPPSGKYKE